MNKICPYCGKGNDKHQDSEGNIPLVGDISICYYCYNVSVFKKKDFKYYLEKIDRKDFSEKTQRQIDNIVNNWIEDSGEVRMKNHPIMKIEFVDEKYIKKAIKKCEGKHIQQIAYSSYHDAFTQICFTCQKIRTSIKKKDVEYVKEPTCIKCGQSKDVHPWACPKFALKQYSE